MNTDFTHNPFDGGILPNAWSARQGDVPELQREAFDACLQAVQTARGPGPSASLVIHGAAGSGKTHLLSRLREELTESLLNPQVDHCGQVYAYVRLQSQPATLWRVVRRQVVDDLLRRKNAAPTQLERLIVTRLAEVDDAKGDLPDWWDYLLDERIGELPTLIERLIEETNVSPNFGRILLALIQRQHRLSVRSWLRGDSLSERDSQQLGLEPSSDDPEEDARQCLLNLAKLAGERVPLVICFDQVEGLLTSPRDEVGLFRFSQLVTDLYDTDRNLALISCMQSSHYDALGRAVEESLLSRMQSSGAFGLPLVRLDQAKALIRARLAAAWPTFDSACPYEPLKEADIAKIVPAGGCTPRELFARCRDLVNGKVVIKETLEEFLTQQWDDRVDAAVQAEPNPDLVLEVLPALLSIAAPEFHVTSGDSSASTPPDIDMVLQAPAPNGDEARIDVSVCNAMNMTSLAARLKRLRNGPNRHTASERSHKLVLIRDEARTIPHTAKATREHLAKLDQAGVTFVRPSEEVLAALRALQDLLASTKSGDVSRHGETVELPDVLAWLRKHLHAGLDDLVKEMTAYPGLGVEDWSRQDPGHTPWEHLSEAIAEVLHDHPVLSLGELSRRLVAHGGLAECSEQTIDQAVTVQAHRFGRIVGDPTAVFAIR